MRVRVVSAIAVSVIFAAAASCVLAQTPPEDAHEHEHHAMSDESAASSPALDPDTMAAMLAMDPGERWMVMLHGFVFLTFNRQSGPSGGEDFESQNHLMTAALHRLWGGKLSFFGTFSLEPATIPRAGAYELFQRGETYNGILLVDRQHPHDFFTELAAQWERPVSDRLTLRLYLAPVGEPALGPIAYPHRLSASAMPQAPLSHHNQDSTHITYDVITAAADVGSVALEGSVFHGAEPDEDRWNIQSGALDSYSGRLTLRPARDLEVQLSAGHLENPESIEPGNQTRYVGAVYYQRATSDGYIAVSLVSGLNETDDGREWGSLAEATWKFGGANFVFGRVEAVDRDLYELAHKTQRPEGVPHVRTRVWAGTAGLARDFALISNVETGVGASATLFHFTSRLDGVYDSTPFGFQAFLRIGFGSAGHAGHHNH